MGCTFCATGTMGIIGNLAAGEIVEQLVHAKQHSAKIRNVVFMVSWICPPSSTPAYLLDLPFLPPPPPPPPPKALTIIELPPAGDG